MASADPTTILAGGQFMGRHRRRLQLPGYVLSHMVPTVPEDGVREHSHADAHYVLFLAGAYVSSAHGAPAVAVHPMLIYNPPGTVHRDRFRGAGGRFFTLALSAVALTEVSPALPDYALVLDGAALRLALHIAAGTRRPYAEPLELESLCAGLLEHTSEAADTVLDAAPPWLRRARELLHDDCGRQLSLTDIARSAGVHPVHLNRVFRQHLHCTPGGYLRRCRLDRAATLLARGRSSLAQIAQACGYFDQAHFCRSFKQAYGMPPRAYREVCLVQDAASLDA